MADETIIQNVDNIKEANQALKDNATASDEATEAARRAGAAQSDLANNVARTGQSYNGLSSALSGAVSSGYEKVNNLIKNANQSLKETTTLTAAQTNGWSALATAALGAGNSFKNISTGFDTTGLQTFQDQWKSTLNEIQKNPLSQAGQAGISGLGEIFQRMGMPIDTITKALSGTAGPFLEFGKNILEGSNQVQEFKNSQIQAAAQTGTWGNVLRSAAPDLSNLNDLILSNASVLNESSKSTGLSQERLGSYYNQLSKIPGALTSQVQGLGDATQKTNLLTAAVNLASGSGRSFGSVVEDLNTAFVSFGVEGENALRMTSRFGEISQRTGAPLNMVRETLKATAEQFKSFANAGDSSLRQFEGLSNITNQYYSSLRTSGMSAQGALSTITDMTKAVSGLTTAQKAFISQQTGGPGGMMGAFQIQKDLQDGDLEGVFNKMRDTIMKQMGGNIVSLEQAGQSEQAANQYQRQIMMLRQGPLGSMVGNDMDASRLLQGLQNNDASSISRLGADGLQQQMKTGETLLANQRTPFQEMVNALEATRLNANITNFGVLERAIAQNPNSQFNGSENTTARNTRQGMEQRRNETPSSNILSSVKELQSIFSSLPQSVQAAGEGIMDAYRSGNVASVQENRKEMESQIRNARARNNMTEEDRNKELFLNATKNYQDKQSTLALAPRNTSANNDEITTNRENNRRINQPNEQSQTIHVEVNGVCIDCGRSMKENPQTRSVSPAVYNGDR